MTSDEIRQKAREEFEKWRKSKRMMTFPDDCIEFATYLAESLLSGGAQYEQIAEQAKKLWLDNASDGWSGDALCIGESTFMSIVDELINPLLASAAPPVASGRHDRFYRGDGKEEIPTFDPPTIAPAPNWFPAAGRLVNISEARLAEIESVAVDSRYDIMPSVRKMLEELTQAIRKAAAGWIPCAEWNGVSGESVQVIAEGYDVPLTAIYFDRSLFNSVPGSLRLHVSLVRPLPLAPAKEKS